MTSLASEPRAAADAGSAQVGRVEFRTAPAEYRHWRIEFDGPVATLTMDVDESGGLRPWLRAEAELV